MFKIIFLLFSMVGCSEFGRKIRAYDLINLANYNYSEIPEISSENPYILITS